MHKLAEKMAECLKAKVEGMGIDNIEGETLVELGMWVDIIKDIAEYDKAMREIEEMDEEGEEDDGRRGYRGQPRDSMGRYMSRRGRRGGRRDYEEPMYYHMTPEMYRQMPIEWDRDMDREGMGKMYYTDGGSGYSMGGRSGGQSGSGSGMSGGNMGGSSGGSRGYEESRGGSYGRSEGRDSREGRSGGARRGYMEAKEIGKEKAEKMKELENYMKSLAEDVTEMVEGASPEEKTMLKQKMQVLMSKIQ